MGLWSELTQELIEDYNLDRGYSVCRCGLSIDELEPTPIEVSSDINDLCIDGLYTEVATLKVLDKCIVTSEAPLGYFFVQLRHDQLPLIIVTTQRNVRAR